MAVKLGNGNWAVKEDKLLAYNDNSGRFFNKEFDFARGSIATYVAKDGLIKSAASDVPRIDFSDSTNGALLLEPQRSNLIPYSQDFSNASWGYQNVTVNSNQIIAPDGTLTADKITDNSTNSAHRITDGNTTSSSGSFTYSIFLKKGTLTTAQIQVFNSGTASSANVDLVNGTITSDGQGVNHTIQDYGNDWFKCSISGTLSNTATTVYLYLKQKPSYIGNGDYLYAWGAQLEEGSYATSYIPTSGSATTRLADVCNNSGSAQDFNSEEGVLYAEISALADADNYRIISLNAGNSLASIFIGLRNNTGNVYMYMPTDDTSYISNVNATNNFTKIALKYKTNDVSFFINGTKVFTDNTVTLPTGLNQLDFSYGNSSNSYPFRGKVKCLAVFTTALTDEQLAALTTI